MVASVSSRGFPFSESVRYNVSRDNPCFFSKRRHSANSIGNRAQRNGYGTRIAVGRALERRGDQNENRTPTR